CLPTAPSQCPPTTAPDTSPPHSPLRDLSVRAPCCPSPGRPLRCAPGGWDEEAAVEADVEPRCRGGQRRSASAAWAADELVVGEPVADVGGRHPVKLTVASDGRTMGRPPHQGERRSHAHPLRMVRWALVLG